MVESQFKQETVPVPKTVAHPLCLKTIIKCFCGETEKQKYQVQSRYCIADVQFFGNFWKRSNNKITNITPKCHTCMNNCLLKSNNIIQEQNTKSYIKPYTMYYRYKWREILGSVVTFVLLKGHNETAV